jgi:hypothetical protein
MTPESYSLFRPDQGDFHMTSTPTLHAVTDRRFTARDFALERGWCCPR